MVLSYLNHSQSMEKKQLLWVLIFLMIDILMSKNSNSILDCPRKINMKECMIQIKCNYVELAKEPQLLAVHESSLQKD